MSFRVQFADRDAEDAVLDAAPVQRRTAGGPPTFDVRGDTIVVQAGTGKDAVCGDIRIAVQQHGRLEPRTLTLPPPAPFSSRSAREMWAQASRLNTRLYFDAPVAPDRGRTPRKPVPRLDWEYVAAAAKLAEELLRRWPTTRHFVHRVGDVERPVGVEAQPLTDQMLESGRIDGRRSASGAVIAGQAVYRQSRRSDWTSQTLATDVQRLVRALVGEAPAATRALTALTTVAQRSQSPLRGTDPPLSSWPPAAALLASAARRAVVGPATAMSPGALGLPVQRVWDLYEKWVGARLLDTLTLSLGQPQASAGGMLGRWRRGENVIELRRKQRFYWSRWQLLGTDRWVSIADSYLEPDYTIVTLTAGRTRLYLADAKAVRSLRLGDLPDMTGKYLAGIRSVRVAAARDAKDVSSDAITEIAIVAPVAAQLPADAASHTRPPTRLRRTVTVQALPGDTAGLGAWARRVLTLCGWQ